MIGGDVFSCSVMDIPLYRSTPFNEIMSIHNLTLTVGTKVRTAIYTSTGEPVTNVDSMKERTDDADVARRLVACWNALAGMSTEDIEAMAAEAKRKRESLAADESYLASLHA